MLYYKYKEQEHSMVENKEERILITKCSSSCHALHTAFGPVGDEENMYCDKVERG